MLADVTYCIQIREKTAQFSTVLFALCLYKHYTYITGLEVTGEESDDNYYQQININSNFKQNMRYTNFVQYLSKLCRNPYHSIFEAFDINALRQA